jgi:opacity protein-like surface antigen
MAASHFFTTGHAPIAATISVSPPMASPAKPMQTMVRLCLPHSQMEWLSTIRGRMRTSAIIQSEGSLVGSTDDTKVGWTAGGGAELAVADQLTLKAEALYFDLGDLSLNATNPQTTISAGVEKKITGVIARGGIGYKF